MNPGEVAPPGPGGPVVQGDARVPEDTIPDHEDRPRWKNRPAFILAAIGSAIGLGNFWRFPFLMYKYGGGTFLIPYLICLFLIGIPMMILELSLGQKMQRGDVGAFARIHPKLRGIGFASVLASFLVASYYLIIIAWTGIYLIKSFWSPLPWGKSAIVPEGACRAVFGTDIAKYHLQAKILQLYDAKTCEMVSSEAGGSNGLAGWVVLASAVVWIIATLSVLRGVKSASWVVFITMPLPFITLVILFFRAVTLSGAGTGIKAYLGTWDFTVLSDPGIWSDAAGQIFFSLSVCYGIMTSYGSYLEKDQPIIANAFIIALSNSSFSFFAGFAVFGVLGFLAEKQGVPVSEVASASITLAFVTYPAALDELPASNFWCVLLFVTLFSLGIDSAFSFTEAITTVIGDTDIGGVQIKQRLKRKFGKWGDSLIGISVSLTGFLVGLLYCADVGLYWLDIVDHYLTNYTVLIDGVLEAVAVTWVWGYAADRYRVGKRSAKWWVFSFFAAILLWILITTSTAAALAPCVPAGWDFKTSFNETTNYQCSPGAKVCDFAQQTINDKTYYVADVGIWAQCPAFSSLLSGAGSSNSSLSDMLLLPTGAPTVQSCVTEVKKQQVCFSGGDFPLGAVIAIIVLLAGWIWSWKAAGGWRAQDWFKVLWFSGADRMMDHILFVDRDKKTGIPFARGYRVWDFLGAIFEVGLGILWKYIIPPVLMFLLVLVFKKDVQIPYGDYPTYMHVVCWVMVGLTIPVFLVPVFLAGRYGEDAHLNEHLIEENIFPPGTPLVSPTVDPNYPPPPVGMANPTGVAYGGGEYQQHPDPNFAPAMKGFEAGGQPLVPPQEDMGMVGQMPPQGPPPPGMGGPGGPGGPGGYFPPDSI